YEEVLTANYTANDNYTVTVVTGDFGITKATMTVTAVNYNAAYDGQAHNGGATASVTDVLYALSKVLRM
ncbi:MAG: hypothetical protein IJA18_03385, partial [Ruminococcus sp.]|nr:hypothetical protein [Ruminococcus sp.]